MMDCFRVFSEHYANGVTAIAAIGALCLASITLWFVMREYANKYQPYVIPAVVVDRPPDSVAFGVGIIPANVGVHPCEFRITNIALQIGDEHHTTPDFPEWMPLASTNIKVVYPVGSVNQNGITQIREGRYQVNRIEVIFTIRARSMEKRYEKSKTYRYEINVLGDAPFVSTRPEWQA